MGRNPKEVYGYLQGVITTRPSPFQDLESVQRKKRGILPPTYEARNLRQLRKKARKGIYQREVMQWARSYVNSPRKIKRGLMPKEGTEFYTRALFALVPTRGLILRNLPRKGQRSWKKNGKPPRLSNLSQRTKGEII